MTLTLPAATSRLIGVANEVMKVAVRHVNQHSGTDSVNDPPLLVEEDALAESLKEGVPAALAVQTDEFLPAGEWELRVNRLVEACQRVLAGPKTLDDARSWLQSLVDANRAVGWVQFRLVSGAGAPQQPKDHGQLREWTLRRIRFVRGFPSDWPIAWIGLVEEEAYQFACELGAPSPILAQLRPPTGGYWLAEKMAAGDGRNPASQRLEVLLGWCNEMLARHQGERTASESTEKGQGALLYEVTNALRSAGGSATGALRAARSIAEYLHHFNEMPEPPEGTRVSPFVSAFDELYRRIEETGQWLHRRGIQRSPKVQPIEFPQPLRPYNMLASVASVTSMHGICGTSATHIAYSLAVRVRDEVLAALPARVPGEARRVTITDLIYPQIRDKFRRDSFPTDQQITELLFAVEQEVHRAVARVQGIPLPDSVTLPLRAHTRLANGNDSPTLAHTFEEQIMPSSPLAAPPSVCLDADPRQLVLPSDLLRYRRALCLANRTWLLLAAHVWLQITARLRQAHGIVEPDSFIDDPDISRSFPEACGSFLEALGQLSEFDKAPNDFLWLWCGGQTLTSSGRLPDLDRWLDSLRGLNPDEWQQRVVGPFLACASDVATQFKTFNEHFEQVKQEVIAASGEQLKTRLSVEKALRQLQAEEEKRQEEQSLRRKRLHDLLTAAVNSTQLTQPAEEWAQRIAARLAAVGDEIQKQGWEDWLRETAKREPETRGFVELMLVRDQEGTASAVELLADLPAELEKLREWLKTLARVWPRTFDQGWLRWKLTRDFPEQTTLELVSARPALQHLQMETTEDATSEPVYYTDEGHRPHCTSGEPDRVETDEAATLPAPQIARAGFAEVPDDDLWKVLARALSKELGKSVWPVPTDVRAAVRAMLLQHRLQIPSDLDYLSPFKLGRMLGHMGLLSQAEQETSQTAVQLPAASVKPLPHKAQIEPLGSRPEESADNTEVEQARKGKRINEQMLGMLQRKPESLNWSAQQWANALGCSKSTIAETPTWKTTIRAAKAREKVERELRQERNQGRSEDD